MSKILHNLDNLALLAVVLYKACNILVNMKIRLNFLAMFKMANCH